MVLVGTEIEFRQKAGYAIEKEGGGAVILRLTSAQYFSGMPAALHRTGEEACIRTGKTSMIS